MALLRLYAGADEFLRVSRLHDPATRTHFFVAAVTAVIRRADGSPMPGAPWPFALQRVPGEQGAWRGVAQGGGIDLAPGASYRVTLTADDGVTQAAWELTATAVSGGPGSSSAVMVLAATPWAEDAEVFGSPVVGVAQMEAEEWADVAEVFGTPVVAAV